MSRTLNWLVTGTSAGLGLALGSRILKHGHNLISLSRSASPAEALTRLAGSSSQGHASKLYHISHDLSDDRPETIKNKIALFLSDHADLQIDVLINNAGIAAFVPVETMSTELMQRIMTINFYSPYWLTQAVLPDMRKAQNGTDKVIVNISSTQGLTCDASELAYDASKHALEALTGVLAKEVYGFGIRTLVVNLGSFRTKFVSRSNEMSQSGDKESEKADIDNPYSSPDHVVGQRIAMVAKYGDLADAARGDVDKAAQVIFDAVVKTPGSDVDRVLEQQRRAFVEDPASAISVIERLILGSDALPKVQKQLNSLQLQLQSCETMGNTVDA